MVGNFDRLFRNSLCLGTGNFFNLTGSDPGTTGRRGLLAVGQFRNAGQLTTQRENRQADSGRTHTKPDRTLGTLRRCTRGRRLARSESAGGGRRLNPFIGRTGRPTGRADAKSVRRPVEPLPSGQVEAFDEPTGRDLHEPTGRGLREPTDRDLRQPTGRDLHEQTGRDLHEPTGRNLRGPTGRDFRKSTGRELREPTGRGLREARDNAVKKRCIYTICLNACEFVHLQACPVDLQIQTATEEDVRMADKRSKKALSF